MRDFSPDRDDPHDALLAAFEAQVRALGELGLGVQMQARLARMEASGFRGRVAGAGASPAMSDTTTPDPRPPKPAIDTALELDVVRQGLVIAERAARSEGDKACARRGREIVRGMIKAALAAKQREGIEA